MKRILLLAPIMIILVAINLYGGEDEARKDKPGFNSSHNQVGFTENRGQFRDQAGNPNPDVLYMADFGGMKVQLRKTGFSYETYQVKPKWVDPASIPYKILTFTENGDTLESWPGQAEAQKNLMYHFHRVDVELVGAKLNPEIFADGKTGETKRYVNVAKGGESVEVAGFSQVRYNDVYPGIDLLCYANSADGGFKYDFILKPGANLSAIELEYKGAKSLKLEQDGNLSLKTSFGILSESIPTCYTEDASGNRKEVSGIGYQLEGNKLKFNGNAMQFDEKLVIDPSVNLLWKTYYNGDSIDICKGSVIDSVGSIFMCGNSNSLLIATTGTYQDSITAPWDGFLMKFDNSGQRLWSTYLNGFNPNDIAIDKANKIIMVGDSGVMKFDANGQIDWFLDKPDKRTAAICDKALNIITVGDSVIKLNAQGQELWRIKYGGSGTTLKDLGCDALGNIYFAGHTTDSIGIATPNAHLDIYNGTNYIGTGWFFNYELIGNPRAGDGFFAKINADGELLYGSYYGGLFFDDITQISVSDSGSFAITGITNSRNGIATSGSFQDTLRYQSSYCFSYIYIGGPPPDCPDGWIYLDTCILSGCFRPLPHDNHCQNTDAFLAKFNRDGTRLWATYYGDTGSEYISCISLNETGDSISLAGFSSGNGQVRLGPGIYISYPPNLSTPYSYLQNGGGAYCAQFFASGERLWGTYYPKNEPLPDFPWIQPSDIHTFENTAIVSGTCNYHLGPGQGDDPTSFELFLRSFVFSDFHIDTIMDPSHLAPCIGDSTAMVTGIITFPTTDIDFQWYKNDQILTGETDSVLVFPNSSIADTGKYYCRISQNDFPWWFTQKANLVVRDKPAFIAMEINQEEIDFPGARAMADLDDDGFYDIVNYQSIRYSDSLSFVRSDSLTNLYSDIFFPDLTNENSPFVFTRDHFAGPSKLLELKDEQYVPVNNDIINGVNIWADFDNDGRIEGFKATNDGFYLIEYSFDSIYERKVGFGSLSYYHQVRMDVSDYDMDGDIDILLIGTTAYSYSSNIVLTILKNSHGTFEEVPLPLIEPYHDCYAQWYDKDADGDLDILYSYTIYHLPGSTIHQKGLYYYDNNGGDFQLATIDTVPISIFTMFHPKPTFVDLDNDGLLDVIYNDLLYNYSDSEYVLIPSGYDYVFPGIVESREWWEQQNTFGGGDMDKDGDMDIIGNTRLFINHNCNPPNTTPSSPTGLLTAISYDTVTFQWERATDLETPQMGLTYNLRVGTTPGGNDIMSSLSDSNGWRKVVGMGNVYQNTSWWLHGLSEGIYYWSVQAIDNSFAGGPFSVQDTFSIIQPIAITEQPDSVTTCPGDSIALSVSCRYFFPLSYQWFKDSVALDYETDSVLVINPTGIEKNGKYYCRINNYQYTGYSDTITITITENIAFHSTLFSPMPQLCLGDSITMKVRKSFDFDCEPLTYQWFRNDSLIPDKNDTLLVIPHFHYADTGYYHCRASFQNLVSNTEPLELSLGMAYHLEKYQAYSLNCIGDSLVLKAQKTGNFYCEPDSCQWFHNGEIVEGEKNTELTLYPFSDIDTGQYQCIAWFDQTSVETDQISLDLAPSYPYQLSAIQPGYLRCPGDSTSLIITRSVTFSCIPDSCQWFKNNQRIENVNDSVLHFEPFMWADTGYYFCRVFIGDLVQNSDTLYMTFETTGFVENPDQTPFNKIPCDIDGNDDFEFVKSLSEFSEGPYTPTHYYSIYNSSNFVDIDHDGTPELIARQDSVRFYKLTGSSYDSTGPVFPAAVTLRCGDLDNDGKEEFVKSEAIWGWDENSVKILFWSDTGYVQIDLGFFFRNISIDIIDIDNDQDHDIFMTGNDWSNGAQPTSKIFLNQDGIFSEVPSNIPGLHSASTSWGDFDLDGDLDLLISGQTSYYPAKTETLIFKNENGILEETSYVIPLGGMVNWIDYDNDGRLDFLVGENLFKWENNSFRLTGVHSPGGLLFDYENDGDLDMYAFFRDYWWEPGYNQIFTNENCNPPNTPPTAPTNLQTTILADTVHFSWYPAADAQTPSPGLSYNMRVGTTPGGCQIMSPMSNPSGFRQVVELGNVQQNLGWWLHNLQPGTYYWSVQAIDNSYAGGPFAPEQTFEILAATHNISIPEGWSGLSSWAVPRNDSVESVFLPIQNQLTILQTMEEIYFPSQNINTIGNWESQSAYQIKVTDDCNLDIAGSVDQNKNFALGAGWNLIPVICNIPVDPVPLFSPVSNDLKIVKDVAGSGVYWPEYGINSLGSLLPGKAYFAKMNNSGTITFPQNDFSGLKTSDFQKEPEQPSPWGWIYKTPSSHLFALPANITHQFSDNSFIGIFTPEGVCAGACSVKKGQNMVLVANPDDPLTAQKDGFVEGEPLSFRIWDAVAGKEYLIQVEYDLNQPDHSGIFAANGISAISGIRILTGIKEEFLKGIKIFPNPTNGKLNIYGIASGTEIKVTIISSTGKSLQVIALKSDGAIDVSHLSSGVYFVKLEDGNSVRFEKVVVE